MDKVEVNLAMLRDEMTRLDTLMNDYQECVELIGHLTRVFNREGYWDFKESLSGAYKRACKHENDLNSLIECMQQVSSLYMESEGTLVDDVVSKQQELYVSTDSLNLEYILGGMRPLTKDESYKLIKSLSVRGDINIGIDAALLLATTTIQAYVNNFGSMGFKLKESTNSTYVERFKLFEEQTEVQWEEYGKNLINKVDKTVYNQATLHNGLPSVIRSTVQSQSDTIDEVSAVMMDAIMDSYSKYEDNEDLEISGINSDMYELNMGHDIVYSLVKDLA